MPNVAFHKLSCLEPLPFANDFDLIWSYGVLHHTGDTYGALTNIVSHAAPGGLLYMMLYAEPERSSLATYQYRHEVYVLRNLTRHLSFEDKARVISKIQGEKWALAWFDAISSEINDLYTMEEVVQFLTSLGFAEAKRTMKHENMLNVVARKVAGKP